jgi:polyhydroxyalkanoate synthesis regulator phasin
MTDSDLTVSILREIRDSIRMLDTNVTGRIDVLTGHVDVLTGRVDVLADRVDVLTERVGHVEDAVKDAAAQILLLTRYVKNKTEVEVADLRERVTKLEAKVG